MTKSQKFGKFNKNEKEKLKKGDNTGPGTYETNFSTEKKN